MTDSNPNHSALPASFSKLIFEQELNKVYLLLDFVSGRADRHLVDLGQKIIDPSDKSKKLDIDDIISRISKIWYPPTPPTTTNNADDATFLLLVKDQLNTLVYPARGLTIAYTTLFTEGTSKCSTSRVQIAKNAFPVLFDNARRFRRWKTIVTWAGLIITVLSALLLWQVTYGAQLAARFDETKRAEVQAATRVYAELDRLGGAKTHNLAKLCQSIAADVDTQEKSKYDSNIAQSCNEYAYRQALFCVSIADIGSFTQKPTFAVFRWLLPTYGAQPPANCLDNPQDGPNKATPATSSSADNGGAVRAESESTDRRIGRQEDAQSVAGVLATMSNYILPILFGLVGTIAALVRGIQDKIRDCILAPRDFALLLIRLPLGMMAGVCVGLFLNPTSVAAQTNGSVGAFTISASGIAFLAGYGAEGFFGALDALIQRIFSFEKEQRPAGPRQGA